MTLGYKFNAGRLFSLVIRNKFSLSNLPAPMHRFYFTGSPSSAHALKIHSSPTQKLLDKLSSFYILHLHDTHTCKRHGTVVPHPLPATRHPYIIIHQQIPFLNYPSTSDRVASISSLFIEFSVQVMLLRVQT